MGLKRRSSEPREEQGEAHRVQGEAKSPGKGSQGKTDTEETETTNKSLCLSLSVCLSQAHAHSLVHILSHPYPPLSAMYSQVLELCSHCSLAKNALYPPGEFLSSFRGQLKCHLRRDDFPRPPTDPTRCPSSTSQF